MRTAFSSRSGVVGGIPGDQAAIRWQHGDVELALNALAMGLELLLGAQLRVHRAARGHGAEAKNSKNTKMQSRQKYSYTSRMMCTYIRSVFNGTLLRRMMCTYIRSVFNGTLLE